MQNVEKTSASGEKPVDQLLDPPVAYHIRRGRHETAFQTRGHTSGRPAGSMAVLSCLALPYFSLKQLPAWRDAMLHEISPASVRWAPAKSCLGSRGDGRTSPGQLRLDGPFGLIDSF